MRFLTFTFVLAFALSTPQFISQTHAKTFENAPASFADLVENLTPAVVNISSTQKAESLGEMRDAPNMPRFPEGSPFEDFFEEFMQRRGPGLRDIPMTPEASLGSGFVIDAQNGYIITNNHVIRDAEEVRVTFQDDETLEAKVIGTDEKTDIAVLQVTTDKKLTAVKFGNSDVLRVGDWIVAIGNPFGLGGTVTAGIVSARARDINAGPYDDFIQTDASINRGNSGGPMFDLNGEVIGINTAIFSPSGGSVGIGFAIPSSLAKSVVEQIIEFGRTRRGWLGVRIQKVTDEIAEALGLPKASGALVASVNNSGPAKAGGLNAGDIILEFNGRTVEDMRALPRIVAETPIDENARVVYWRDGKKQTTTIKVAELEKAEENGLIAQHESGKNGKAAPDQDSVDIENLGLSLLTLNEALREEFSLDTATRGVLIGSVKPLSEAAKKGLFEGDIIVEINQTALNIAQDVKTAVDEAVKNNRSSILLLIDRNGDMRFVALKLPQDE